MRNPLPLSALSLSLLLAVACADDVDPDGGTSSAGGGSSSAATSGSTSSTSSASTGTSQASSSASTGQGGGAGWPSCDSQPVSSTAKTIAEVWSDNPAAPSEIWLTGVHVIGVAKSGCTAGEACQIFVQQSESYASFATAAHGAIRIGIAPAAAQYFVGISVGDQVDVYGHAFRDTANGANELQILVTPNLAGCAKVVGAGDPQPVTVTLDQLTVLAYEETHGPVLVRVDTVSGNPNMPVETFALWDTGSVPNGDITAVTSLSPFFLAGALFTGLTEGVNTDFGSVTGVFALFAPPATPLIKYEEIYVRTAADYPLN